MNFNGLLLPDRGIYFKDEDVVIYHTDCRDLLPLLSGISAVVTDPPYGLGFMNKEWDNPNKEKELIEREKRRSEERFKEGKSPTTAPFSQSVRPGLPIGGAKEGRWFQEWCYEWAKLLLDACLPSAPLLSFSGTRTSHRLACAVEDAGWQIRDTICWVYGSGFPKSLDISKAIDKQAGAKRGITEHKIYRKAPTKHNGKFGNLAPVDDDKMSREWDITAPATPEAKLWDGYGTALKPAYEPIIVAMKPLDGTFANNALKYGVAGLDIDGCRVPLDGDTPKAGSRTATFGTQETISGGDGSGGWDMDKKGRFPANFIHDGSQEVMELFPNTKSGQVKQGYRRHTDSQFIQGNESQLTGFGDSGSAARFFYTPKASRKERDAGLEDMPDSIGGGMQGTLDQKLLTGSGNIRNNIMKNNHPTVKPLALMTYLCKLVKMPEYNLILDPFCGSGSTLLACKKLGIPSIGIDLNEEYCEIAKKRLSQSVMRLG